MIIAHLGSHRAFEKAHRILGDKPFRSLWSMKHPGSEGLVELSEEDFDKIKHIKMISKSRVKREELMECWGNK